MNKNLSKEQEKDLKWVYKASSNQRSRGILYKTINFNRYAEACDGTICNVEPKLKIKR
jgi:hypothetical protein